MEAQLWIENAKIHNPRIVRTRLEGSRRSTSSLGHIGSDLVYRCTRRTSHRLWSWPI